MRQARLVASMLTAGGLLSILVTTLFGPPSAPGSPAGAGGAPAAAGSTASGGATGSASAQGSPATTTQPAPQQQAQQPPPSLDSVRLLERAGLRDAATAELRRWVSQNATTPIPADIRDLVQRLDDTSLDLARRYVELGQIEAARTALQQWIQQHPKSEVPPDLLRQLDEAPLDLARKYKDVGLIDSARTTLQQWVQQHPKSDVPEDLASLLPGPTDDALPLVRAYKRAGLFDQASTELQRWIQRHPNEAVPADLRDLVPGWFEGWLWFMNHRVVPWVGPVLVAAALAVLIVVAVVRSTGRPPLVISEFELGGVDGASLGKVLAASMRQQLNDPRGARSKLDVATGPIEPVPIPAEITSGLSSAVPLGKVISSVLPLASLSRVVTVSGILHPPGPRGAGLTVMVAESQKLSSSVTIWQKDFEPDFTPIATGTDADTIAALYDDLIPPAVTWLRFYMHDAYGSPSPSRTTSDWRSHAQFEAGIRLADLNRTDAAKKMYLRALARDPGNDAAQLNLALLLPPTSRADLITQLEAIVRSSRGRPDDSTYYSAAYSLATALVDAGRLADATAAADDLVQQIDRALTTLGTTRPGVLRRPSRNADVERYLRVIAPSAQVIAATLHKHRLPPSVDLLWPSEVFQYNLACYYSTLGAGTLTQSIERLEFAAALDRAAVVAAATADQAGVLSLVATDPATKPRFDALIAPPAPVAVAPSVLAQLTVIGPARAAALKAQGVASPADLVVRCSTAAGARTLAAALGVSVVSLARWAAAAELLRLAGMQPGHVNALTLASLDSLGALRGRSTATIVAALTDFGGTTPAPTAATVDAWALDIAANPSLVAALPV